MKILHVFPANTGTVYQFLKEFCNSDDKVNQHDFLVTNNYISVMKQNTKLLAFPELKYMVGTETGRGKIKRFLDLYKILNQYDKIVWHSFIPLRGNYVILLFLCKKYLQKSVWVEWGEDLFYPELPSKKVKRKLKEKMLTAVKSKISVVGITMPTDKNFLPKGNDREKNIMFVRYPVSSEILKNMNDLRMSQEKHENVGIQIGLSSHLWNNHRGLFTVLEKYKDENIHFYIPGNYYLKGNYSKTYNKAYKQKILTFGKNIFQNKLTLLNNMVSEEIFFRYLELIDVVVLADIDYHEYEYTMTYLMILLYLGKKVFLPEESNLFRYLKQNEVKVFPLEELAELNFENFVSLEDMLNYENDFLINYFDREKVRESWEYFFINQC